MNEVHDHDEARLRELLREALPSTAVPPGFEAGVWRRIEADGAEAPAANWFDSLLDRLLQPRFALTCAALVLVMGSTAGVISAAGSARESAQQRYVQSVSPHAR
jgi:hypothetical protein